MTRPRLTRIGGGAGMFMGEFRHNIDDKGRIIIPARFREELGDGFIITKGLDRCLFVYPEGEWSALTENLKELPFTRSEVRSFVRFFFSGASECSCDGQGRTVIPPTLRDYGQLNREAIVIGVGNRIEIWSSEKWSEFREDAEDSYEEMAEKLTDMDLF